MSSLNFMFLCSLIEELCTKEENDKTGCNFNFGHECILLVMPMCLWWPAKKKVIFINFFGGAGSSILSIHLLHCRQCEIYHTINFIGAAINIFKEIATYFTLISAKIGKIHD